MPKERITIRVRPVTNIKELMRCVFYNSPSRFVEPALLVLEYIINNGGCVTYDVYEISSKIYRRHTDVEYVIKKMLQLGMLEIRDRDIICVSDKFSKNIESILNVWNQVLKHVEKSRIERFHS